MRHILLCISFFLLSLIIISSCSQQKASKPLKPVVHKIQRHTNSDVLLALSNAHLELELHDKEKALEYLGETKEKLPSYSKRGHNQSDLLVALTYLHRGTLHTLYIPTTRNDNRYKAALTLLDRLHKANIQAQEYQLVTYEHTIPVAQATTLVQAARSHLQEEQMPDIKSASLKAEQELRKLYQLLNAQPYDGTAQNRFEFHILAAEKFLAHEAYALSNEALHHAEEAVADIQLKATDHDDLDHYTKQITTIREELERKDPPLASKLGTLIKEAVK